MAEPQADDPRREMLSSISHQLTQLFARLYGRGPTSARSVWAEDVIVCRMIDPFTTAERTLIELGRREEVNNARLAFQAALDTEFKGVVERVTGQRVETYVSAIAIEPDVAIEVFVLARSG